MMCVCVIVRACHDLYIRFVYVSVHPMATPSVSATTTKVAASYHSDILCVLCA
eukprot:m.179419 g.179419  ORF g.179419 m.179419 type:complete len:53 (+) comp39218_c0_seq26:2689-2847(+)